MNNYYILYNEKSGLWEIWNTVYSYIEQYAVSEKQAKELMCLVQEQNDSQPVEDGGATPTNTLQN